MKNKIYLLLITLFTVCLHAKSQHFVVIDAATPVPFSVLLQGKIYQSSPEGHLIIPKLNDTTYFITLRTTASKGKDYNFTFNMDHRDHGWILKPLGQSQYELYDWQTETSLPSYDEAKITPVKTIEPIPATVVMKVEPMTPKIVLWKDAADTKKRNLSYIVKDGSTFTDTISISIDFEVAVKTSITPQQLQDTPKPPSIKPIIDSPSVETQIKMVNSDCKLMASEKEINKLRMKMLHDDEPEDRLETVRHFLRSHCITTGQTRSLAELFFTPDYMYKFLDVAYPHVSDSDQFNRLIDLITDEHNRTRFKAMVRMQ